MASVTYNGPRSRCTIASTGTVLHRGHAAEVTEAELRILAGSSVDITIDDPAGSSTTDDTTAGALDGLRVAELRDIAAARGLPVSGTKAELIARLAGQDGGDGA